MPKTEGTPSRTAPLFFFGALLYIGRRSLYRPVHTVVMTMTYYASSAATDTEPAAHASLWHRFRPAGEDGRTSFLFWLTVLAIGCVSLMGVTWIASFALSTKGSEKLLRVGLLFPKLKSIHGERKANAFRMSEPEPSELAHPKERKTSAPGSLLPAVIDHPKGTIAEIPPHAEIYAATPEPPAFAALQPMKNAIPALVPPPIVETCNDPVVFLQQCPSPPGDSPMIRNWKTLTMYSLLSAAVVTLAPPPAIVFAEEKKSVPAKAIDDKVLQELADRVGALENKKLTIAEKDVIATVLRAELKKFEEGPFAKLDGKVEEVKTNVASLKTEVFALQAEQLRQKIQLEQQKFLIDQLSKRLETGPSSPTVDKAMLDTLKAIQEGIAKLGPTKERVMMSPPNGSAANMGRVMLVNLYTDDLLFLINDTPYRVPAGKSRPVDNIPAGTLQFRVHSDRWGTLANTSTSLLASETFTLTATPQR